MRERPAIRRVTIPQAEQFDVVVLGGHRGGKILAWRLGQLGKKVAVVERHRVRGPCPAVADLPLRIGAPVDGGEPDVCKVGGRKRHMIDAQTEAHPRLSQERGVELILGSGRFIGPKTIEVRLNDGKTRTLNGSEVVVNVGAHAAIPDLPGLAAARPLTRIEALKLDYLPQHLIVLGGERSGIELAQTYRRLGSRVTVVEPGRQFMGGDDPDTARKIHKDLLADGVDLRMGVKPLVVMGRSGDVVTVKFRTAEGDKIIQGSDLLVATGQIANTADIGLEAVGVALGERGFIHVNERLETTVPGIWAIGECAGSPQFTHVSVDDFKIVRDNMAGAKRRIDDRQAP